MEKIKFNKDWKFTKSDNSRYQEEIIENPENVTLPDTYNADDGQSGNEIFRGDTWYQNTINVTEEDLAGEVYLEIGAASLQSKVYVNGKLVSTNQTGYSLYRVHLTEALHVGENLLAINVSNKKDNTVYPIGGDFTFYGGLYRDVYLIKTNSIHFDLLDGGREGFSIVSEKQADGSFTLTVQGSVVNEGEAFADTEVKLALKDDKGNVVLTVNKAISVDNDEQTEFKLLSTVVNPTLWDGVKNPYLYTLELVLEEKGMTVDRRTIKTGFRTIEITSDKGVFLNGNHMKLNGVSRHQDFADVGNAISKEIMELDMSLIKEMGANTIRLSHYQHDDYFYQLCDEAGMLVWTEIPFNSYPSTTDLTNQNAKDQLLALIKQTRNHVSVFSYGIQNEITIAAENERIYHLVGELNQLAKELDPQRYTAQANIYSVSDGSNLNQLSDIVGYNLYYGWYYGELEGLGARMDAFHEENPNVPVMVSEYGTDANPVYHTYDPKVKDYTEEYQVVFHENAIRAFNERQFVLGGTVWNMFDFGSAHREEGGTLGKNQKGLVTIDRKIKKDAFYLYKANWSADPFIKIAGSRFVKRHAVSNDFILFSNLGQMEVHLNGDLIGEYKSQGPKTLIPNIELVQGENELHVIGITEDGSRYEDYATFELVVEQEESYIHVPKDSGRHVINWFEKFDLSDVQEVELKEGYYSTHDSIGNLLRNEQTNQIVTKFFGELFKSQRFNDMREAATIEGLSKLSSLGIPKELLTAINAELNVIEKEVPVTSRFLS